MTLERWCCSVCGRGWVVPSLAESCAAKHLADLGDDGNADQKE